MSATAIRTEIKTVGRSGQISLGKTYAGRLLRIERQENGGILLTPVAVVPESQLWTLGEPHRAAIERGMAWAARNPAVETDLEALSERALSPSRRRRRGAAS